VVQLGQNFSNSTRVKIFRELGQRIKSNAARPLNQNSVQLLIPFNAGRFDWLESSAEGKLPRDEQR
jgi:hypothetical protein